MPEIFRKNLWVLMTLLCLVIKAQPLNLITDPTATPVAYEPLREADIAFQWTLERVIDTREKQNLAINWPHNALRDIVMRAVLTGQATAYTNNNFTETYADTAIPRLGIYCHWVQAPCPDNPEEICDTFVCEDPAYDKMVKWKIVEQWYFDKEQSRMIPRIIGLAMMYRPVVAGLELPETPLFWVKYDDVRKQLAQNKILNPRNEASNITYDHFFQARLFSSYVTKYPNAHDMQISEMEEFADNSMAALYESQRIRNRLFETEHDLWEY